MSEELNQWGENQRSLARALGLTIEAWLEALAGAAKRKTGLTAAVVGASMAKGLGMTALDGLDGDALLELSRKLIDPTPPRVENPVLKEAIRRSAELGVGTGKARLKRKKRKEISTPTRGGLYAESSTISTPDAPGVPAPRVDEDPKGGDD